MALPDYVGGTSGVGTSNGYTVSLSGTLTGGLASSPAEGDVVVVFSGFGNTASSAPNISGNASGAYQAATAAQHVNDTWDVEFRSFYQIMGATPDSTLTVTRVTNTAYGGGTELQVWRGVDPANPFIGAATPASGSNGNAINPPSYDPGVTDAIVIAGGAGTLAAAAASAHTAMSGASNLILLRADGSTADISLVMGSYAYAGSAIDPAACTGATTSTSAAWAGVTLALRAEILVVNGNASGSLSSSALTAPDSAATGGASASGGLSAITQTAPTASATGSAAASGSLGTVALTAPTGSASGLTPVDANASGTVSALTLTAATAAATGGASITAALAAVTQTAATATATGTATANGALSAATLTAPAGSAAGTVSATATGALATATLTAPTSAATGGAAASGALQGISLTAPTGTASGASVVNGNASGSLAGISLTAATAQAVADAQAIAVFAALQINPATGAAYGTAAASGSLAGLTLTPITATARGTDPSVSEPGAMVPGRATVNSSRPGNVGGTRAGQVGSTRLMATNTSRPTGTVRTTR